MNSNLHCKNSGIRTRKRFIIIIVNIKNEVEMSRFMAEYMISRASIINRCNKDGKLHLIFSEKERPCEEAYLKELKDTDGNDCSRYFIKVDSIEEVDKLGMKYDVDVLVTRNLDFEGIISLVLYDEEIDRNLFTK